MDWRVRLKCPEWSRAAQVAALNASKGGVFISTSKPPPIGSRVELVLDLPDGRQLPLRGMVQHVLSPESALAQKRGPGAGIRIDPRHQVDLLLLEEMAAACAAQPSPPPPAESAVPPPPPPPEEGSETDQAAPPEMARPKLPRGQVARAVGLDFGTTYSSLSVAIGDRVCLVADHEGRLTQPSIVAYPEKSAPLAGWKARELLVSDPRRVVTSAKRLLGRKFSDPTVAGHLHSAAYKAFKGPNDSVVVEMEGKVLAVPQICAEVMNLLRETASRQLGIEVKPVVLSAPVTFGATERAALKRAAEMAKLEVIEIIDEPVAGALAYGIGQAKNEIVAVYDFGGGTFDFSVLDVVGDHFRVLVSKGDSWLGGDDFDLALAEAVANQFWRQTKVELRQRVVEWQRLLLGCEQAKRQLTGASSAKLLVERMVESPRPIDLRQNLDRATFQSLCQELLDRSLSVCQEALEELQLEPSDMTQVVVMGGVSRIPFVAEGVGRFFDREIQQLVNPDEAVALGAGLRAAQKVSHPVVGVAAAG